MTTLDMEIALMRKLGVRRNIIVPNISWSFLNYEADLVILSKNNYATEVEIKVSKADLVADKKKHFFHNSKYFKYFYYAVPEDLVEFALKEIPETAGLYAVYDRDGYHLVRKIRGAKQREGFIQWSSEDKYHLAELGCMRILTMKKQIKRLLTAQFKAR